MAWRSPDGRWARISLLVALFEAFDDVGRIVRVELRYRLGQNLVRKGFGNLVADAFVELGQNFVIEGRADRLDELDALFRLEEFDDVGKIGRFEIAHEFSGARSGSLRPSASEMARIRSGDGVPSELGRRLNVAVFSQRGNPCAFSRGAEAIIGSWSS